MLLPSTLCPMQSNQNWLLHSIRLDTSTPCLSHSNNMVRLRSHLISLAYSSVQLQVSIHRYKIFRSINMSQSFGHWVEEKDILTPVILNPYTYMMLIQYTRSSYIPSPLLKTDQFIVRICFNQSMIPIVKA